MSIAVLDDRIEIRSFGHLPSGISPESLTGPHQSVLRNPLIAQTFHRTGAVETSGRGTNRVIEICRENGVELPVFELQGNRFAASTSTIDVTLPFARRKSPNGVDFLAGVGAGRASLGAERLLCSEAF